MAPKPYYKPISEDPGLSSALPEAPSAAAAGTAPAAAASEGTLVCAVRVKRAYKWVLKVAGELPRLGAYLGVIPDFFLEETANMDLTSGIAVELFGGP